MILGGLSLIEAFFALLIMLPLYAVLIWSYFYPVESMLFGERWLYKDEPEFSDIAIGYTKLISIIGIFILTMILVSLIFNHFLISLLLVLGLLSFVLFGVLKLRSKLLE